MATVAIMAFMSGKMAGVRIAMDNKRVMYTLIPYQVLQMLALLSALAAVATAVQCELDPVAELVHCSVPLRLRLPHAIQLLLGW